MSKASWSSRGRWGELARIRILGVGIDPVTMADALTRIEGLLEGGPPGQVITANPEMVMLAGQNESFAQVFREAALVVPDGYGLIWASRVLGCPLPERVAGIDLLENLAALAASRGYRLFLLGAREGVAAGAAANLQARHPGLIICGAHHGYFSPDEERQVLDRIREARPHILAVALGAPRQELWLAGHQAELGVPVGIGVGGSFDVLAGKVQRAPRWMQARGLEWLYRLLREPWRYRRMLFIPRFAAAVLREKYTGRREHS
ncbi:MAG: WecB/TagA/CpsF family glycosyltransferase [Firmicutes bacterium]|jgi:N-acetylglucosaminyldiphosphoundecaprenol N-acetyl-beta-D-mannosaminyltransferase|nr:WecB/TagA/CpsF family glycosyltransferase [Bacillota bacterium]